MIACDKQRRTGHFELGDLFAAFNRHLGPLAIQGLLTVAIGVAVTLPVIFVGGVVVFLVAAAGMGSGPEADSMIVLVVLLILLLVLAVILPIYAAIWFAPALIVLHDLSPMDAMKTSLMACFRNWLPMTVYGLVFMVLAVAGMLPCLLGLLLVLPMLYISIYTSYRDIFFEPST